jgi:hypothetical protein
MVNLHTLVKNSFVGHIEHLMSFKHREFTSKASVNSTLLLKLDSAAFFKNISESSLY